MFKAILEGIIALLTAIPYFDKWFTKSVSKKVDEAVKEIHDGFEEQKNTGRPPE